MTRCPACGGTDVESTRVRESFTYGIGTAAVDLSADVDRISCRACTLEFTDVRAEAAHDAAVRQYLAQKDGGS